MKENTPELKSDIDFTSGLAAVALFVVLAVVFVTASFPTAAGFADGVNVVGSIGYSMFDLDGGSGTLAGEGMLAVFEIVDLLLVGALVGGVMLARREEGRSPSGAGVVTDGGRPRERSEGSESTTEGEN